MILFWGLGFSFEFWLSFMLNSNWDLGCMWFWYWELERGQPWRNAFYFWNTHARARGSGPRFWALRVSFWAHALAPNSEPPKLWIHPLLLAWLLTEAPLGLFLLCFLGPFFNPFSFTPLQRASPPGPPLWPLSLSFISNVPLLLFFAALFFYFRSFLFFIYSYFIFIFSLFFIWCHVFFNFNLCCLFFYFYIHFSFKLCY